MLYEDPVSQDAAIYIARPSEWDVLREAFLGWIEGLDQDEDEEEELLPNWLQDYVVFGEIPQSGNYLLMPTEGEKSGFIIEFEHDGFEFIEYARNIEEFVSDLLDLGDLSLGSIASHMRFVEGDDWGTQWWIARMEDNRGNVVKTRD